MSGWSAKFAEILAVLFALVVVAVVSKVSAEGDALDFNRDVRPILSNHCYACHGPDENALAASLRLDQRVDAIEPAKSGKRAIVPGEPDQSELIKRVFHADADERMPPADFKKPLTEKQRQTLRTWIRQGARYAPHWSFVLPERSPLPSVSDRDWPISPVDRFVLARIESAGLKPNAPADRARLLRRVYLDVIGLPPSVAEVDAFLADESPDVYEKVVDRLLASPKFGEKWARHWLDLARYADSNGFQRDGFRDVWAYRDWVINAMNADKPYDQFIIEQIAGDLLPDAALDQKVATGFHRQVTINLEAGTNPKAERMGQVMDRVNTTGTVFLGLTLECAQCHNHKFDPIDMHDYYSLLAYFNNTPMESKYRGNDMASLDFTGGPAVVVGGDSKEIEKRARLQSEYDELLRACTEKQTPEEKKKLDALSKKIAATKVQMSLVMEEMPEPRQTHVLVRGQWDNRSEKVTPGVPKALHALPDDAPTNRVGLARWLASRDNPLTARVAVNRWWLEIFGRGIVATPEDFGTQGEAPSHPQLLDWLAVELMDSGWSMKHVIRTIVTSATYRQSSRITEAKLEADPSNILLARGPRFRLQAETIRDNALAISGLLSDKMHGPPVMPPQPPKIWRVIGKVDNTYRTSKGEDRYRRGLYTIWRRSAHYPSFANFDAPNRGACVVQRRRTNTPLQALTLLNDPAYVEFTAALAKRLIDDLPDATTDQRVRYAWRLCVSREPTTRELEHLRKVYQREFARLSSDSAAAKPADLQTPEEGALFFVANILLNLDETITKG